MTRQLCPPQFAPVLRQLVENSGRYFGDGPIVVEPQHHYDRPFSTILKIRVARAFDACDAFIKIVKPRGDTPELLASMRLSVQHEFEVTSRVHAGLAAYAGLSAVRPIACFPEHLAIVTEQASGPTLNVLLRRNAAGWPRARTIEQLAQILGRIGTWLRAFQTITQVNRPISLEAMRAYLDARIAILETPGGERLTLEGGRALRRCFDHLGRNVPHEALVAVPIHADLCPENIVTREDFVTVLDFTMAKSGCAYHDLAHLFMHIDLLKTKPWYSRRLIDRLQQELLNGFEPGLAPTRPLFALVMLQHVICHLVSLRSPARHPLGRLYAGRVRRRHRRWLQRCAGVGEESWT